MTATTIKAERLRPDTRVIDLARSELLNTLNQSELVVLLRIVAASATRGRTMQIKNADLHTDVRTARRALEGLEKHKLVSITFAHGDASQRTIELLK